MRHEADRGSSEVVQSAIRKISEKNILSHVDISVLEVEIPRGFCDLNRPWERACPEAVNAQVWKSLYEESFFQIENEIAKADHCLHIHSMCSQSPIYKWIWENSSAPEDVEKFLTTCYSGEERRCNILSETTEGVYITDRRLDTIAQEVFTKHGEILKENEAYRFPPEYPVTKIALKKSSSLLEITKGALATEETCQMVDTSHIVLDPAKVDRFGTMLADIIF